MYNKINNILNSIREMQGQFHTIIEGYKKKNSIKIAGLISDIIPVEILQSFDIVSLFLPASFMPNSKIEKSNVKEIPFEKIYDLIVLPESCRYIDYYRQFNVPLYIFKVPSGLGEAFQIKFCREVEKFLNEVFSVKLKRISRLKLKESVEKYNYLRRTVRGISSLRLKHYNLINNSDLFTIFQAAAVLPFEVMRYYFENLIKQLGELPGYAEKGEKKNALVTSPFFSDPSVLDKIEDAGCLVVEDDSAGGRRLFDLSFNASSPDLYNEIFEAYSYKLFAPFIRPVEERYLLFYKMIKKYGIDLVIFLEENGGSHVMEQTEFLRKKLMRRCVDPITAAYDNAYAVIKEYSNKSLQAYPN